MCTDSSPRSPRVESYGWLSVFVVFTCSFCLFLTHLLYLQLVHKALACFFFTKQIPLGVHRFLAEALALNLTADYLYLSSLYVPSACFLHICSTFSSYMRPWLVFSTIFSARSAQIPRPKLSRWILRLPICVCLLYMFLLPVSYTFALPPARTWGPGLFFSKTNPLGVHRFLAEALALNLAADYLCLSSLHVPSACFLHLCSTFSSYMRPWLVLSKKNPLGVHRFLAEALALNLAADYLCLSYLHVPSACFLHINFALDPARTWGPGLFFLTCSSVCRSNYPGHVICI